MDEKIKNVYGFCPNGASEGACLVFAFTAKDAINLAYPVIMDWFDTTFTDVRTTLIKDSDYLLEEADKKKLENNIPHIIKNPKACKDCSQWGCSVLVNKLCEDCR